MKLKKCFELIENSQLENKEDCIFEFASCFLGDKVEGALDQYSRSNSKNGFYIEEMIEIINEYLDDNYEVKDQCKEWIALYCKAEEVAVKMNKIRYP